MLTAMCEGEWITHREAARRLGCAMTTFRTLLGKGHFAELNPIVGRPKVLASDIDRLVAASYRPRRETPAEA